MKTFTHYFALGDSMSIDCYPFYDLPPEYQSSEHQRVGSASLLYSNDSAIWSAFEGLDLLAAHPSLVYQNLAIDGATTFDLLDSQYYDPLLSSADAPLVTLTIGGNDLLSYFNKAVPLDTATVLAEVEKLLERYNRVVEKIQGVLPKANLIVSTVYDPTDGSGRLPGYNSGNLVLPAECLDLLNNHIRQVASTMRSTYLADVHAHFAGHGASAPLADRWYWKAFPIEPSARGASEIRRVWLKVIETL